MKTAGIEVRPLVDILNRHTFNQIFFENVRIPRNCLVGELNRGWYVGAATLDFERSGINRVVAGYRTFEELIEWAVQTKRNGRRVIDEGPVRTRLADLAIEFTTGRMLAYRVAWMQSTGQIPNAEASMSKLFGSELQQRLGGAGIEILGLGVLLLTSFLQSLNGKDGLPYFVLLLVEALLVIWWGTLQKRKIPFFAGIGASALNILAQLIVLVSVYDINRWFVAFGAGLLIMGFAIYIERSREQLRVRVRELSETLEKWE
jgi:alkylation response protein AidB-like acyl-CoA dehydrogenase